MRKYSSLGIQIAFFLAVGLVTLGIDLTVTTILYNLFHLPAYLASGIGFLSGFFFNFPMNRKRVFKHSEYDRFSLHAQVVMYISLSLFNLFMTSFLVEVIVGSNIYTIGFAKLFVTALIAAWNFLIFKFLIFSKTKKPD